MTGGVANNIDNVIPVAKNKKPTEEPKIQDETPAPKEVSTSAGRELLSWEGASFDFQEKNVWWYVVALTFVAAIIGYFVWTEDWYLIAVTIVVSIVMFWYVATARPKNQKYSITPFGLTVDEKEFPYSEMHSFWIVYNAKVKKMYVTLTRKYLPSISIDLGSVDPARVRTLMRRKLPEQIGQGENLLDRLLRILKF